jgi:hypothetical protein
MKPTKFKMAVLTIVAALGLFAFTTLDTGSIKGTVSPANSLNNAMLVSGTDTLKAVIVDDTFSFVGVKAGTYKLIIEASGPYKKYVNDAVIVEDNKSKDLGTITLQAN